MKEKTIKFFSDYKYSLIIFCILAVQAIINMIPFEGVGELIYLYYLADLSMGKTSRLLMGTIINWLTDNPTKEFVNAFAVVFVFITLFLSSLLVGKVISGVEKELKPHVLVFTAFLVSGTFTFAGFSRYLGFFDVYLFLISLIAVVFLQSKYLKWLVPLLCAVCVFIHQGFAFTFFPIIILVSFYKTVSDKKPTDAAVFLLSAVTSVVATLFCVLKGTQTMNIPFEQMREIISERASFHLDEEDFRDVRFFYYGIAPDKGLENAGAQTTELPLLEKIAGVIEYNQYITSSSNGLFAVLSLAVVLFVIFWIIWIKCIKHTDNKGKKFVYLCFMLAVLIVPLYSLLAADFIRWVQAGMLTQFILAMFMFFMKDEPFECAVAELGEYFKNKKFILVLIYLVHALAIQRKLTG